MPITWEVVISYILHKGDIPHGLSLGDSIAIDTETLGLNNNRDRLCLIQISGGDGKAHLVQFEKDQYNASNLKKLLENEKIEKIMHYARFDVAVIHRYLGVSLSNIFCTKIASKLTRTYTDKHGLKDLCKELLGVDLSKHQQTSDWGQANLSKEQLEYAASDVLYLHQLKDKLVDMLKREKRLEIAKACFNFVPARAELDILGWPDTDIFQH